MRFTPSFDEALKAVEGVRYAARMFVAQVGGSQAGLDHCHKRPALMLNERELGGEFETGAVRTQLRRLQ